MQNSANPRINLNLIFRLTLDGFIVVVSGTVIRELRTAESPDRITLIDALVKRLCSHGELGWQLVAELV